jgi:hypothetical protein
MRTNFGILPHSHTSAKITLKTNPHTCEMDKSQTRVAESREVSFKDRTSNT